MSRKAAWSLVAIAVAACAWLFYVLWSTVPFQDCLDRQEKKYEATHEAKENPPKGFVALFINARDDTVCGFSVLYEYRDAVTALATVFIASFTLTLWLSTKRLSKEAETASGISNKAANAATKAAAAAERTVNTMEDTAERQLRAYISVSLDTVIFQNAAKRQPFVVFCDLKNSGQTPARSMFYNARADMLPYPLPEDFDFPMRPEQEFTTSTGTVGTDETFKIAATVDRFYNWSELVAIRRGKTRRLYMYDTIHYRDIFGKPQYTDFSQSIIWRPDGVPLAENTKHHTNAS